MLLFSINVTAKNNYWPEEQFCLNQAEKNCAKDQDCIDGAVIICNIIKDCLHKNNILKVTNPNEQFRIIWECSYKNRDKINERFKK